MLPRSPLPEPTPPATHRPKQRRSAPVAPSADAPIELVDAPPQEEIDDVVWIDDAGNQVAAPAIDEAEIPSEYRPETPSVEPESEAVSPTPEAVPRPARRPHRPRPTPEPAPPPESEPERPRRPRAVAAVVDEGVVLVERRGFVRRHRLGLVFLLVGLLVSGTVAYRVWLQRLENLPLIAETNWTEGREALEAGRFDEAKQKLGRAASAFERLGITDERGSLSRQLAAESAILADLCSLQPDELIEEAARFSPAERWPERFQTIYKGQSIILDSTIRGGPASSSGAYELDFQIFSGRGPVPGRRARIDLAGLRLLESTRPKSGQAVLFGARLDSLSFQDEQWTFRLEPDSGVVLTHPSVLEATGWDPRHSAASSGGDAPAREVAP